ncbi:hypothetical protein ACS0TY_004168 [Phlomoides rotata]
MEAACSCGGGIPDFSFGFDDTNYSDRTLLLEIMDEVESDDDRTHNVKRRRRNNLLITPTAVEPRVKSIHINSLILAARSPFFRKLFSNGMLESEQKNVTLRIDTSEEASLMDLLKYVYSNNLPTSLNGLLDLLVRADKFEVASCLRDCTRSLQNLPMTCESASLYLDLPPSLLMSPIVDPLTDAAKQFLIALFKDLDKFKKEMLNLPLAGVQAVLSSDDLEVTSENVVYDFVLGWAQKHYSDLEERRGILKTCLLHLIRFPFMTATKLTEEVQTCSDIDPEDAFKIVIRALGFKAETPHRKRCLAAEEGSPASSHQFVERSYKRRLIKLVELELPHQQCIVYVHFRREQLTHIFPEGVIMSETFHLGNQELVLIGRCSEIKNVKRFWLALQVLGSATCTINYEIQLRMMPTEKFKSWVEGSHTFSGQEKIMNQVKVIRWTEFIDDDSTYFINDVLHVRAEITIKE